MSFSFFQNIKVHLNLIWIGRRFWNKLDIVDIVQDIQPQHLFWKRRRLNPLVYIESDTLFKLTYCFSKPNVKKIAEGLSPHLERSNSNRGDLAFTLNQLYRCVIIIRAYRKENKTVSIFLFYKMNSTFKNSYNYLLTPKKNTN